MAVFHVNPKTLEPGRCRAQKKCPFGGEENHFPSQGEAQKAAEERLKASYDVFSQRGDYAVGEEIQLGSYYDTPGGKAKVIELEKDSVKVQSLEDYETYWVPKEFANNPRSVQYLGRKNSTGNFVTSEELYVSQATERISQLKKLATELSSPEQQELDRSFSANEKYSEEPRSEALRLVQEENREAILVGIREDLRDPYADYSFLGGTRAALEDAALAELVQDKLSPEDYWKLTRPVYESSSPLKDVLNSDY